MLEARLECTGLIPLSRGAGVVWQKKTSIQRDWKDGEEWFVAARPVFTEPLGGSIPSHTQKLPHAFFLSYKSPVSPDTFRVCEYSHIDVSCTHYLYCYYYYYLLHFLQGIYNYINPNQLLLLI
jgi:hypothetical protein